MTTQTSEQGRKLGQAAKGHNAQMDQLGQALLADAATTDCPLTIETLADYVDAQLSGRDYRVLYPEVTFQLTTSPHCLDIYLRLYQAISAEKAGKRLQPTRIPQFDLSFLPSSSGSTLEQIRAALQQVGNQISLQLSLALLPIFAPPPALSVRGETGDTLVLIEPDQVWREAWPATIHIYRQAKQPEYCIIQAQVKPQGRPFPHRKGIQVRLSAHDQHWQASTDAYGNATLSGLPVALLPAMKIEIVL